ncbi:calcium uniporter protein, mitochondrial isoform X2 [Nerophis lumbriciformis]|uniref:calcium uniporter protein, mitochondrial isoform X2 n=1 Tax=Nerophis lumbriciformis TaxID=546530 RepID=UPI002ADF4E7D|nr:calcium uniporter protein, mitochondrial-like isoform X2 [Nerophis lumbriciformis]
MAAKVCRSVLLLSRSGGAAAGSLPALVAPSQRHQQHVRPQVLTPPFTRQTVRRAHGLRSTAHSTLFTQPPNALSPQVWRGSASWHSQRMLCSPAASNEVTVVYQNGLPVISVSLPSRRERCQFTLKPLSDCVGVFLQQLQAEDRGIDRVAIYSTDGARVASSTGIDILLLDDFKLVINDTTHLVRPPRRELLPHEETERLNDVKFLVQQLYTTLRIEEHQLTKERELIGRLEDLNAQLRPLEKVRQELSRKAERRTTWVLWGGMAYMATQFGILARLTWWEYSWDIMEPVTYFITYGTAMAMYAYFVLTRQEYLYPDARDRQYLLFLHKGVKRTHFDIEKYNKLKDDISEVELDLKRLRDPLQLQLPVQQLNSGKD